MLKQNEVLTQTQILNQQCNTMMLQSLHLLQLNQTELVSAVKEIIVGNPLLEWDASFESRRDFERIDSIELLDHYGVSDQLSPKDTLMEHVNLSALTRIQVEAAKLFIDSLDEKGFLAEELEEWIEWSHLSKDTASSVLDHLREFAPGIGSSNMIDCLIMQLEPEDEWIATMLKEDLERIAGESFAELGEKYEVEESEIRSAVTKIKSLSPYPFYHFSAGPVKPPAPPPEASIQWNDGWEIELHDWVLPSITVNLLALDALLGDREVNSFIQQKKQEVNQLLFSLEKRNSTLIRTIHLIAERQTPFLRGQTEHPIALSQKEIAVSLMIHPSTISRTVQDKAISTPRGIVELKNLFPRKIPSSSSKLTSVDLIREIRMIVAESSRQTDQEIMKILNDKGIWIKRRTVNKYRNLL